MDMSCGRQVLCASEVTWMSRKRRHQGPAIGSGIGVAPGPRSPGRTFCIGTRDRGVERRQGDARGNGHVRRSASPILRPASAHHPHHHGGCGSTSWDPLGAGCHCPLCVPKARKVLLSAGQILEISCGNSVGISRWLKFVGAVSALSPACCGDHATCNTYLPPASRWDGQTSTLEYPATTPTRAR